MPNGRSKWSNVRNRDCWRNTCPTSKALCQSSWPRCRAPSTHRAKPTTALNFTSADLMTIYQYIIYLITYYKTDEQQQIQAISHQHRISKAGRQWREHHHNAAFAKVVLRKEKKKSIADKDWRRDGEIISRWIIRLYRHCRSKSAGHNPDLRSLVPDSIQRSHKKGSRGDVKHQKKIPQQCQQLNRLSWKNRHSRKTTESLQRRFYEVVW